MPNMLHTKKSVPKISMTKGKQFTLWEEEVRKAKETPGPLSYAPSYGVCEPNHRVGGKKLMGYG